MQKEYHISQESELSTVVDDVFNAYQERDDKSTAFVLALHGTLGAGKTTFMQHLAKKLGIEGPVTSPTFVVMKKYPASHGDIEHLVHIDAYRIEEVDEMRPLRFDEELGQKGTIIGIEWAEHIEALLPPHTLHLSFTLEGEVRIISTHAKEN